MCSFIHTRPCACSIVPGTVIVLFFQYMTALLGPTNRMKEGKRWGIVAHTVALFSVSMVSFATGLVSFLVIYMNAREFPGTDDWPMEPLGYFLDLPKFVAVASISSSVTR